MWNTLMKKMLTLALSLATVSVSLAGWQDNVNTWFANSKGTVSSLLAKCANSLGSYNDQIKPTAQGLWQQAEPYKYYIAGAAVLGIGYFMYKSCFISLAEWQDAEVKKFRDLYEKCKNGTVKYLDYVHEGEKVKSFSRDGRTIVATLSFNVSNNFFTRKIVDVKSGKVLSDEKINL